MIAGIPGGPELYVIAFIILLLFGKNLAKMMGSLGQGIAEFRKGVSDGDEER